MGKLSVRDERRPPGSKRANVHHESSASTTASAAKASFFTISPPITVATVELAAPGIASGTSAPSQRRRSPFERASSRSRRAAIPRVCLVFTVFSGTASRSAISLGVRPS